MNLLYVIFQKIDLKKQISLTISKLLSQNATKSKYCLDFFFFDDLLLKKDFLWNMFLQKICIRHTIFVSQIGDSPSKRR